MPFDKVEASLSCVNTLLESLYLLLQARCRLLSLVATTRVPRPMTSRVIVGLTLCRISCRSLVALDPRLGDEDHQQFQEKISELIGDQELIRKTISEKILQKKIHFTN